MIGVLLVDDEALTLDLHREYVERLDGFRVVAECSSARAALRALLDSPVAEEIDLVLLDMTMPDASGLDVLRHVRARARDVDVIVTNHSFMAIDAFEGRQMLPEHDVLVVDEGHELVDRVTSTITDEVTPAMVRAVAPRVGRSRHPARPRVDREALDRSGQGGRGRNRLEGVEETERHRWRAGRRVALRRGPC